MVVGAKLDGSLIGANRPAVQEASLRGGRGRGARQCGA